MRAELTSTSYFMLVIIVCSLLFSLSSALYDIKVNDDNTFMEGSRFILSFTAPDDESIINSRVFDIPVSCKKFKDNALYSTKVEKQINNEPSQIDYIQYTTPIHQFSAWNSYYRGGINNIWSNNPTELRCWKDSSPEKDEYGFLTVAYGQFQTPGREINLEHSIIFRYNAPNGIASGDQVSCYIQHSTGSPIQVYTIDDIDITVTPSPVKVNIGQLVTSSDMIGFMALPIALSNVRSYTQYDIDLGIERHLTDVTYTDNDDDTSSPNTTTTKVTTRESAILRPGSNNIPSQYLTYDSTKFECKNDDGSAAQGRIFQDSSQSYNIAILNKKNRSIQCILYIPINDIYSLYKKSIQTFEHKWKTSDISKISISNYAQFSDIFISIGNIRYPLSLPLSISSSDNPANEISPIPFNISQKSTIQPIICYSAIICFINRDYEKIFNLKIISMTLVFSPVPDGTKYDIMALEDFKDKYTVKTGSMDSETYLVTFTDDGEFEVICPEYSYRSKYWAMRATIQTTSNIDNTLQHDDSIIYTIYKSSPMYGASSMPNTIDQMTKTQSLFIGINVSKGSWRLNNKSILTVSPLLPMYPLERMNEVEWPVNGHWYKYVKNIRCQARGGSIYKPSNDSEIIHLQPQSYMGIPNMVWVTDKLTNIITGDSYYDTGFTVQCFIEYHVLPYDDQNIRYPRSLYINIDNELSLTHRIASVMAINKVDRYKYTSAITLLSDHILKTGHDVITELKTQILQKYNNQDDDQDKVQGCINFINSIPAEKLIPYYSNNVIHTGYSYPGSTSNSMGTNKLLSVWVTPTDIPITLPDTCSSYYTYDYIEIPSSSLRPPQIYMSSDVANLESEKGMYGNTLLPGANCQRSTQCLGEYAFCISLDDDDNNTTVNQPKCTVLDLFSTDAGLSFYDDYISTYNTQDVVLVEPDTIDDDECYYKEVYCQEVPCEGEECTEVPCEGEECPEVPCEGEECTEVPCEGEECTEEETKNNEEGSNFVSYPHLSSICMMMVILSSVTCLSIF